MPEATRTVVENGEHGRMEETVLSNGVRIVTERMPAVRSAAVGVWVRQGAAHESDGRRGASHLLEHLAFKGTERRTAREIARGLESLGGSLDAYTGREQTSYQARVLDEHVPIALDVLADLILSPLLRSRDLELEREVVLEEIATVEDTPEDLVFEAHAERLWRDHPYGYSILGTRQTVTELTAGGLRELHRERYLAGDLVVAATGHVAHDEVVEQVVELFGDLPPAEGRPAVTRPSPRTGGDERIARDTAQTHVVFGTGIPAHSDPRRYPLVLLNTAFGGGMSSRLFQRIREELALAYTVYSFHSFYAKAGVAGVYVGTRPDWDERAVEAIRAEYRRIAREGLSGEELAQAKRQVKGQIMLSLESTGARLYRLAGFPLYDEPYLSLDELLARVEAVSVEEVAEVSEEFFDPDRQLVLRLGPPAS